MVEWWNLFFKNYFYVNYSRKYVKKCEKPLQGGVWKGCYCIVKA